MNIELVHETLNGIKVFKPEVFEDERGFFMEVYKKDMFNKFGIKDEFVQDNHSKSSFGVLRGLHFQWNPPMAKLMRVTQGEAFLVAVDIRKKSIHFGQWFGDFVSAANKKMIYAPAGFARGFCVTSETAEIQYKCSGLYNSNAESGILWNDKEVGINWPDIEKIISKKDQEALTLSEWTKTPNSNLII